MTTSRDPDRLIHAFLLEGAEQLHDQVYDAVRAGIEQKRQWAVIGPWRVPVMSKFLAIGLGGAAVVVALFVGAQLLGRAAPGDVGGPPASPIPLAVGIFSSHGGDIELDASGDGSNVTGTMRYTDVGGADLGGFVVDLACSRTGEGGLILIGGPIIESTKGYVESAPKDTNVALILQRGSPVKAEFFIEHPDPHEPDCMAFLDSIDDQRPSGVLQPIDGTIELRP